MLYRRYYMIAHVLLNVLNEFGISERMRGLLSILSPFGNEFNKFNYTRARMLDSIYQIIKSHFWRENVKILQSFPQPYNGRDNVSRKSKKKTLVVD